MTTRTVPTAALRFTAKAEFRFAAEGVTPGKPIPVHIVARSDQPVDHWYWGKVVHDLAGMRLAKKTIPLDYLHDPREVIGFANRFTTEGQLEADGALVPITNTDRATEIATKSAAGVPYEASIDFGDPSAVKIEVLAEGQLAQVNGYTLEGPATIVREWPLRGIALCPYGVDAHTSAQFSADSQTATVTVTGAQQMPEEKPLETTPPAETPKETPPAAPAEPPKPETPPAEPAPQTPPPDAAQLSAGNDPRAEFAQFAQAFGDEKAAAYYKAGKSFAEALTQFAADQAAEIKSLRERLAAVDRGESDPLTFSQANEQTPPADKPDAGKFRQLGGNISRLAAGMKLAKA